MKWMYVALLVVALSLTAGCADTADAEDSTVITPVNNQDSTDGSANSSDGPTIWIAIIMTWNPVIYTIDKEFVSEINCWNYYDNGAGESKMLNSYGTQVLDHQGNKPGKEFHKNHRPPHREYPIRFYKGITAEQGQVWLTCDIKGRN